MVEAIHRLQQAQAISDAQRQAMGRAVMVLAQRSACEIVKRQLRAKGVKLQHFKHREIVAMARYYLAQHPELIAEARQTALRWAAEGFFGKRAALSVQHSQDLHSEGSSDPQGLSLCETHAQNGATR